MQLFDDVERFREIRRSFVLLLSLLTGLGLAACDETPSDPGESPRLEVEEAEVSFPDIDPVLGVDETASVTLENAGGADLRVESLAIEGPDAAAFAVAEGGEAPFTLSPGATRAVVLSFTPMDEGEKSAEVVIASDDPSASTRSVAVRARAVRFGYVQVDRVGIPALNTVFNHPSGVAGFDKVAYNVASPASDVATYRDQFVTVLEAVANPDPESTADLLLPDELPVSMGAETTSFAELTGRAPADDATDVALAVTVGVESLRSDRVPENDRPFLDAFPFFAPPHE